jgi:hypothetical protein
MSLVAEYRAEKRTVGGGNPRHSSWRLWRDHDVRVREFPPQPTAENWQQAALLIAPQVLHRLPMTRCGLLADGHPYRRYMGLHDDTRWDITLRTDLMLPVRIEREQSDAIERLQLVYLSEGGL